MELKVWLTYILTLMVIGIHNYNPVYHTIRVIRNDSTVSIVYSWALKRQKWWKKMQESTGSEYVAEPLSFGQIYHVVCNNFPFRFSWSAASEDTINSFGSGWKSQLSLTVSEDQYCTPSKEHYGNEIYLTGKNPSSKCCQPHNFGILS